jgi:NADH:ubiquinone reductase (non-electrogenic)
MGMMAYLGSYEGLFQAKNVQIGSRNEPIAKFSGWKAWLLWRSAYFTKLGSWRLRLQVPIDWLKAMVVGRDVSRF